MDYFSHKSKSLLIYIIILFSLCFFATACSSGEDDNCVYIKLKDSNISQWGDIFDYDGVVSFQFSDPEESIYTFGMMRRNSKGDYFVVDGKAQKLLMFDSSCKFKKYIGHRGEGPAEYMLLYFCVLDGKNNLYLYDVQKMSLNVFKFPDYNFVRAIRLPTTYQDIIVTDDEYIIGYSTSDPSVIHRISLDGKKVEKYFEPEDLHFRTFSARFQLGRLSVVPGKGFLFSYPDEYKIFLFDYNINAKKTLVANDYSNFVPEPVSFPKDLDPFGFSPKHSKWWGKSIRPAMIYYLGGGYFLKVLVKFTNLSGKLYVNLHNLDGSVYAQGVEIPFNGRIVYVKDKNVYLVEPATVDKDNNIIPLKLHKYRLKDLNN